MMKKFLIFVLVLGLASVTQAGIISLEVEAGGTPYTGGPVADGTVIDVYVVQDAEDTVGSGGEMLINITAGLNSSITDMTPSLAGDLYGGWDWGLTNVNTSAGSAGSTNFGVAKTPNLGAGTPGLGVWLGHPMLPEAPPRLLYEATLMFSFELDGDTTIAFTGGTWDGIDLAADGPAPVTIPEPITIALLGLGALFMRRRK